VGKKRPEWDEYFLEIARLVATRSTCRRRNVGAVIVGDKRLLTTGYNGAPAGLAHCLEVGCLREKMGIPSGERQELCRGLHAEQNAIIQAALYGVPIAGATVYVTCQPCTTCVKMLVNCKIRRIVTADDYPDEFARQLLTESGIKFEKIKGRKSGG